MKQEIYFLERVGRINEQTEYTISERNVAWEKCWISLYEAVQALKLEKFFHEQDTVYLIPVQRSWFHEKGTSTTFDLPVMYNGKKRKLVDIHISNDSLCYLSDNDGEPVQIADIFFATKSKNLAQLLLPKSLIISHEVGIM